MLDNFPIWDEFTISIGPDISDTLAVTDSFKLVGNLNPWSAYKRTWGVTPPFFKAIGGFGPLNLYKFEEVPEYIYAGINYSRYADTHYAVYKHPEYYLNPIAFDQFNTVMRYNPSPHYFKKLLKFFYDLAERHDWDPPSFNVVEDDLTLTPFDPNDPDQLIDNRHLNIKDWLVQIIEYIKNTIPDYPLFFTNSSPDRVGFMEGAPAFFTTEYEKEAKWSRIKFGHPVPISMYTSDLKCISFIMGKRTQYPYGNYTFSGYGNYSPALKYSRLFISVPTGASPTPIIDTIKTFINLNKWGPNATTSAPVEVNQRGLSDLSSQIQDIYNNDQFCIDNGLSCSVSLETSFDSQSFWQLSDHPNASPVEMVPFKTFVYKIIYSDDNFNYDNNTLVNDGSGNYSYPYAAIVGSRTGSSSAMTTVSTTHPNISSNGGYIFGGGNSYLPIPSEVNATFQDALNEFENNGPRTYYLKGFTLDQVLNPASEIGTSTVITPITNPFFEGLPTNNPPFTSKPNYTLTQSAYYVMIPIKDESMRKYYGIYFKNNNCKMKIRLNAPNNLDNNPFFGRVRVTNSPLKLQYAIGNDKRDLVSNKIRKVWHNQSVIDDYGHQLIDLDYTDICDILIDGLTSGMHEIEQEFSVDFNEQEGGFFIMFRLIFPMTTEFDPTNDPASISVPFTRTRILGVSPRPYSPWGINNLVPWITPNPSPTFNPTAVPFYPNYFSLNGLVLFELEEPLWCIFRTRHDNFVVA